MTEKQGFDPSRYLTKVGKGDRAADYLEVKWRLVWLRDVAPDAVLRTEHIRIDDEAAIFKASITLPSGGHADGYGNVRAGGFPDYIGKAETVAIGRALAALGFGTQFAGDFVEDGQIADAPVRKPAATSPKADGNVVSISSAPVTPAVITGNDLGKLKHTARQSGWSETALATEARRRFGEADLAKLTPAQGTELLDWAKVPASSKAS